jgi:flagellar export protein FliJ
MKAFRFRLQRVLELRESEVKAEEAALERLRKERLRMEAERDALLASLERETVAVRGKQYVHPSELVLADAYREIVKRESQLWAEKLAAQDREIEKQRARVVAFRGGVKLLEKLRDRRREEWQQGEDRELEELAGEFGVGKWVRET